jgi:hypothetical protein
MKSLNTLASYLEEDEALSAVESKTRLNSILRFMSDLLDYPNVGSDVLLWKKITQKSILIDVGQCRSPSVTSKRDANLLDQPTFYCKAQECVKAALGDSVAFWMMDVRPAVCLYYPKTPACRICHCCALAPRECADALFVLSRERPTWRASASEGSFNS